MSNCTCTVGADNMDLIPCRECLAAEGVEVRCSCGTRYVGPGGCPGCGTRAVLDFRTGKVTTYQLGRRIGEDPAAPLLRLRALLDEASRDLQQQAAGAAHDADEVRRKLRGMVEMLETAAREYDEAIG